MQGPIRDRVGEMLLSLRPPEEMEPAPGFYARVMQRIEEQSRTSSIWSVFIDSPFGKRLVFASLSVALALGSYVVAQESRDGHLWGTSLVASAASDRHYDMPVMGSQEEQRDAVLANIAEHERVAR
jgi:hypothetical protein